MSLWRAARRQPAGDAPVCRGRLHRRTDVAPLAVETARPNHEKIPGTLDPATHFLSLGNQI